MDIAIRVIAFYLIEELNIKDIEKVLFTTKDQKEFHFFLFHNKELHFSKEIIRQRLLVKKFESVEPQFYLENNKIIMRKEISNFNLYNFDNEVDSSFLQYQSKIKYRIESIFQTFKIFNNLYKDKSIVYLFPFQLEDNILNYIKDIKIDYEKLDLKDELIEYFDILHWINYFSKLNLENDTFRDIKLEDFKSIMKLV